LQYGGNFLSAAVGQLSGQLSGAL